jgi:predicted dehydrogenase
MLFFQSCCLGGSATMPDRKELKVALIGTGFVARAHANAFRQVGHFYDVPFSLRPKVVCGRNPAKLQAFANRWEWDETCDDWRAVVQRTDIDIVDIAVPNALHAPIALAAAAAGKMVFCEKPLALSVAEAKQMAGAATRPNLVWYNYRRIPAVAFAKQLIAEGKIGQLFHYRAYYFNQSGVDPSKSQTWRYQRAEAGSGAMGDLLSHCLDTATYLHGDIRHLCATTHTFVQGRTVDDAVLVMASFDNGGLASFEVSRFGVGRRNGYGFEVYGSNGSLSFDLEDLTHLRFYDATEAANLQGARNLLVTGPNHPYAERFWKPGHVTGYEHTFIATLGDFLECLAAGTPFQPDFKDALHTQKLLSAVEVSAKSGTWVNMDSPAVT